MTLAQGAVNATTPPTFRWLASPKEWFRQGSILQLCHVYCHQSRRVSVGFILRTNDTHHAFIRIMFTFHEIPYGSAVPYIVAVP